MFTYQELASNCRRQGINPFGRGKNIMAKSKPVFARKQLARLDKIGFPREDRFEVEKIGRLIFNLVSQEKFPRIFNSSTLQGKKEIEKQRNIEKILPAAKASHKEWFKQGLEKTSFKMSDFILYNGVVYATDKEALKRMEKMNDDLVRFKRESDMKQFRSEQSAKNLILNA